MSVGSMSEKEQLELAMALSRVENSSTESRTLSVKAVNQPCSSQSCEELAPRMHTDIPKSTHTTVFSSKSVTASADLELEKALKLSLEEFESTKQRQHHRSNALGTDDDFEKALELSKMEYEQLEGGSLTSFVGHQSGAFDRSTEHEKVVESSKMERVETSEVTISGEHVLKKGLGLSKLGHGQGTALDNQDQERHPASNKEDSLLKAIQSRNSNPPEEDSLGISNDRCPSKSMVQDVDDVMAGTVEQSEMGFSKEQSRDGDDLAKALELSRIEYMRSKHGVLFGENEDLDSEDLIMLENRSGAPQSRDQNVTLSSQSPLVADSDRFVPSSVASDPEWDLQSENHDTDMFETQHPASLTGNTRDSAILLDSQEQLDDTEYDFAYALHVQQELREQMNNSPSKNGGLLSEKNTTCSELDQQLIGYRQLQKEKYGKLSGQKKKSSPGVEFRRNVAAIARGKPVQIGVASRVPSSRSIGSQRGHGSGRVLDRRSMSRHAVNESGAPESPKTHVSSVDEVHIIR